MYIYIYGTVFGRYCICRWHNTSKHKHNADYKIRYMFFKSFLGIVMILDMFSPSRHCLRPKKKKKFKTVDRILWNDNGTSGINFKWGKCILYLLFYPWLGEVHQSCWVTWSHRTIIIHSFHSNHCFPFITCFMILTIFLDFYRICCVFLQFYFLVIWIHFKQRYIP